MRWLVIAFLLVSAPALAQQQRPTPVQLVAQQLALAIAQNAELVVRNGELEEQTAALRKQVADLEKKLAAKPAE